jgi:hypothetical protein
MDENISEKPQISFLKKVEKLKRYYFHSNRWHIMCERGFRAYLESIKTPKLFKSVHRISYV